MFGPLYGTLGPLGATWRKLVASGSTLLNGLVSYWPLNETSGVRNDVVGTNHLTDNNTVGAVLRGPEGTAASFVTANSESLSSSSAALQWDDSQTMAFWFNPASLGQFNMLVTKDNPAGTREFGIYVNSSNILSLEADGTAQSLVGGPTVGVGWHFVVAWRDADGTVHLQMDLGSIQNGSPQSAVLGSVPFRLGARTDGYGLSGRMGPSGKWSRILTAEERIAFFNSGHGKRYADLTTAEKVGLVSYWNLDEVSGPRNDSHGTNHLTDNNTVGSVNSGPKGVAASFVAANNESLTVANGPTTVWGQDGNGCTVSLWLYPTGSPGPYSLIFGRDGDAAALRTFNLLSGNPGWPTGFYVEFYPIGGPAVSESVVTAPTLNAWNHLVMWLDPADKKLRLTLNGTLVKTTAAGSSATLASAAAAVGIGGTVTATTLGNITGLLDEVAIWSRILTAGERASLFNSGCGKRYADLTTDEKVGLVSYWNLDEGSGVRYDSHGSNNLTDNNTVGSVINAGDAMDGAAASFVRANTEYLSRGIGAGLIPAGFPTISGWFKLSATLNDNYQYIFRDTNASTLGFFIYIRENSSPFFSGSFGDGTKLETFQASSTPTLGDWHHFVAWVDSGDRKARCSIDGGAALVSPGALGVNGVAANTTTVSYIGINNAHFPQGLIDEVAIWNRVLTADERAELFALGRGKYHPFPLD